MPKVFKMRWPDGNLNRLESNLKFILIKRSLHPASWLSRMAHLTYASGRGRKVRGKDNPNQTEKTKDHIFLSTSLLIDGDFNGRYTSHN